MPLKEGGHHRRALDLAAKKKALKQAEKEQKSAAGERGQILAKLLELDPDADLYLDSPGSRPLCRAHFRLEDCFNRRCKLSHEYTIADAVSSSSSNQHDNKDNVSGDEMPALELVPGILGARTTSKTKRRPVGPPTPGAAALFEGLPGDLVVLEWMVSFFEDNSDIYSMMRTCRFLRISLMECNIVMQRRQSAVDALVARRNQRLLAGGRATAARLRFAVSYSRGTKETSKGKNNYCKEGQGKGGKKKKKGRAHPSSHGPTLAYDHENAAVFRSFQTNFHGK